MSPDDASEYSNAASADSRPRARMIRNALALAYMRTCISALPRLRGRLALSFYRLIYPDFSVGTNPRCWGGVLVMMESKSRIQIGDRFSSTTDVKRAGIAVYSPCKLRTMAGGNIIIGDDVSLNGTSITSRARIEIGDGTMVAANVIIIDSDFHQQWPPADRREVVDGQYDEPVSIGKRVWLGLGAIVLKGATVGDNSIIGAGSVVTGAIPSNVVAAGVPAKVIRRLGDPAAG